MAQHYYIGFLILLSCSLLDALPRPTVTHNNEETTPLALDTIETESDINDNDERSLMYEEGSQGNTKDIVERIKAINDAMRVKKPTKRPHINWNTQPETGGGYIMDKDVLEKLQQIIASGKLHSYSQNQAQEQNVLSENDDLRHSRQMAMVQGNQGLPIMSTPYMASIPVLVMPQNMNGYSNIMSPQQYGSIARQEPQSPLSIFQGLGTFQFPTFGSLFPILIRDPILSMINGGGWSNFIQTGQEADVCRKQKSAAAEEEIKDHLTITDRNEIENNLFKDLIYNSINMRKGRAIKKRTVLHESRMQDIDDKNKSKKINSSKATTTRKPVKRVQDSQDTKTEYSDEGDLRFQFGEFSLFGNKKHVTPSPGIFINRMKVRRGGVAIAGPGGVATAGRGGTAIVGPGGLAYTQPGGLAVAGPNARVIALSHDADLHSIISRLQEEKDSTEDPSTEEEDLEEDQMSTTTMESDLEKVL